MNPSCFHDYFMRDGLPMCAPVLEVESNGSSGHTQVCWMSQYDSTMQLLYKVTTHFECAPVPERDTHTTPVFGSHLGS